MTREFFKSPFRIQQLRGGQDGHRLMPQKISGSQQARPVRTAAPAAVDFERQKNAVLLQAVLASIGLSAFGDHALDKFARHLRRCRCKGFGHTHQRDLQNGARLPFRCNLVPALGYCRLRLSRKPSKTRIILVLFRDWMRRHRGTCDATLYNYNRPTSPCVAEAPWRR